MTGDQVLSLLLFELSLSLLSVGGVIVLAPEQYRFLVDERQWLTATQFQSSITLAQAAPGPNVLFLALWGWHVGVNAVAPIDPAGGVSALAWANGLLGAMICLIGTLGPSSLATLAVGRWTRRHEQRQGVQALRLGLAPVVVGAMASTAWLLARADGTGAAQPGYWLISAAAALLVWRTKVHLIVMLAAGAVAGLGLQGL